MMTRTLLGCCLGLLLANSVCSADRRFGTVFRDCPQCPPLVDIPAGSFWLADVLGNVSEWLEDCYNDSYSGSPTDGRARTTNCSSPTRRVVRGGGYSDASTLLRAAYRLRATVDGRYATLGFRVARSID